MDLTLFHWVVIPICLTLSFLFSGMEAGVFALSRLRVRQQARIGSRRAKVLHQFLEKHENFLWTILVGNTLVNFVIFGWLVAVLHRFHYGWSPTGAILFGGLVFLFYALFDLLPKMLFRKFPNRLSLFWARPFKVVHLGLRPLVALVESSSNALLRWTGGKAFSGHLFGNREELRQMMQESAKVFTTDERTMINRVLELQTLTVRQVATPLTSAVTVSTRTALREAKALARDRSFSRLPVWDDAGNRRRIVGLIEINSLLYEPGLDEEKPVADFVKPALYLAEDERLEVALRRMQRGGQRLAVVLSRSQRESGILTLEDILKVIFGEVKL